MNELILHPGPRLLRVSGGDASLLHPQNVTEHAVEFLFSHLELAPDLRLSDLVGMFEHCSDLHSVWWRFHSEAICAEAALGPLPDEEGCGLLFLQFRQSWFYNSHLREYSDVRDLQMVGIGRASEVSTGNISESDSLDCYSLLGMPIRDLLTLPVRLSVQVRVFEADPYAVRHNQEITTVRNGNLTLGELLQAMLRELTWFGPPQVAESVVKEMAEQFAETDDWTPFTAEDFWEEHFGNGYRQSCQVVFESTGSLSAFALERAVGQIPDGIKARQWIGKTLGKAVRLRPAFRELTGRCLREAIAQAQPKVVSDAQ